MDNINIWFARNKDGNIVTIDKIDENNRYEEYSCPICESKLIPKLGDINAHHLAHKDASKCSRETQIHFFVKNELLKQGDIFTVKLDNENKEFICKEILVEQEYKTEFGTYKPDITIITEDNKTIYFEVAHTNKKKIEDYLDIWIALNNIVVEIETKEMIEGKTITEFDAKFYEGKCFNIRQEDKEYYELVGKLKVNKNKYPEKQVNDLNFLWKDINKYLLGEVEISDISDLIQSIDNEDLREIVSSILRKNKCTKIMEDYISYNIKKVKSIKTNEDCNITVDIPNKYYDKVYGEYNLSCSLIGYDKTLFCEFVIYDIDEITNKILLWIKRYKKIIEIDSILKNKYIDDELRISSYGLLDSFNVIFYTEYISDIKTDDSIENIIKNICDRIDKLDKNKEIENYTFDKLLKGYNGKKEDIDSISKVIKNNSDKNYIESRLRYNKNVLNDYINHNINNIEKEFNINLVDSIKIPRVIYDRIFGEYSFLIKNIKFNYTLYNAIDNISSYFYKKEYVNHLVNLLEAKNKISLKGTANVINPSVQIEHPYRYKFTNVTNMNCDEIDDVVYCHIDLYDDKKQKENVSKILRRRYCILLSEYIIKKSINYKEKMKINTDGYHISIYYDNTYIKMLRFEKYLNKEKMISELDSEINKKILEKIEDELLHLIRVKTKSKTIKSYDGISIEYEGETLFKVNKEEYSNKNKIIEKINKLIKSKEVNKLKINNFINYIKNNTNDCNLIINNTSKTVRLDYVIEGILYKDFYKYTIRSTKYCSWKNDREEIIKNINESINNYKMLRYIKVILNKRYENVEGVWYFETYSNDGKTYLELRKRYNKHTYDGYVAQDFEIDLNYKEREKVLENLSSDICNYLRKRKYPWYNK